MGSLYLYRAKCGMVKWKWGQKWGHRNGVIVFNAKWEMGSSVFIEKFSITRFVVFPAFTDREPPSRLVHSRLCQKNTMAPNTDMPPSTGASPGTTMTPSPWSEPNPPKPSSPDSTAWPDLPNHSVPWRPGAVTGPAQNLALYSSIHRNVWSAAARERPT